jgi:lysophospholipase L1-like esterase
MDPKYKMLDCLILGDSIAVGTYQQRPDCVAYAKGGWNTWQWNRDYLKNNLSAKTVIISLGSNDHSGVKTKAELQRIREKVGVAKVFWILPAVKPDIQAHIREIAEQYNDTVLPFIPSSDKIHPTTAGYRELAKATK